MTTPDIAEARRLAKELTVWARDYATTDYTDDMASKSAVSLLFLADELERLRAQVASLSREAWTWSKALEAQLAAQVAPASTSTHSALDVLRELREWDHRGDTVQEHWDEIYGRGAFDAVLNAAPAQPITSETGNATAPRASAITPESAPAQQAGQAPAPGASGHVNRHTGMWEGSETYPEEDEVSQLIKDRADPQAIRDLVARIVIERDEAREELAAGQAPAVGAKKC